MENTKSRLEYSKRDGFFHIDSVNNELGDVDNSYACICKELDSKHCSNFTHLMMDKYPDINTGEDKKCPSVGTIKEEFGEFLLSLLNDD